MILTALEDVAHEIGLARGLWLENRPDIVEGWVNVINSAKRLPLRIEVVADYGAALERLEEHPPDVVIVDIRLERSPDGITFAKRVRKSSQIRPLRIVSSYLPDYSARLHEVPNPNGVHDRAELADHSFNSFQRDLRIDAVANRVFEFYGLDRMDWYEFLDHPFQRVLSKVHWRLFAPYVRSMMAKRDSAWAVVCGRRVVSWSADPAQFPSLQRRQALAERYGKVPFVYSRPIVSEESRQLKGMLLNHYPHLQLVLGSGGGWADLDTGTNHTLVSDELTFAEPGSLFEEGNHLGRMYEYCVNRRAIILRDAGETQGGIGPVDMPVAIVTQWNDSPWRDVNPKRDALVGRDIFANVAAQVEIASAADRSGVETRIRGLKRRKEPRG